MEQSGQIDLFEVIDENPQHYSKLASEWEKLCCMGCENCLPKEEE